MKRIHIVGSGPRTGTTLLAEAMTTCFAIDYYCEHEESLFTQLPDGEGIFLTKKPGEFMSVRWPLFFDKNLYVICLIRDPRDTVVSIHGSRPNEYWTSLKFWKRFASVYNKLKTNRRFVVIRYEDFVSNPDATQKCIQRKLPFLSKKYKFSDFHRVASPSSKSLKAMRELRPIEPIGVGNWKKHLPRVKQQVRLHGSISESLVQFSYESGRDWESMLESVEVKDFIGKKPEFFSPKEIAAKQRTAILASVNAILMAIGFKKNLLYGFAMRIRRGLS